MRSYLSLIPISAKVHKRQNRMTLLCIVFAVFLVTTVFSMAEMGIRMEQERLFHKHGSAITFQTILGSSMGQTLLIAASVLFVLILVAAVLMISSSMNSSVAQRTQFFGMMRCIGMSKNQIIRFVRLEALNWCKTAIPIGVLLGVVTTWGLCAILKFFVGEEFSAIPVFGISIMGILSGIILAIITVLLAASVPARRAAKVSPVAAVSGNVEGNVKISHAASTKRFKIETALGINHAVSAKKNFVLMASSFALSIVLFLTFSVLIDFVGYLMPQSSATPDITILSKGTTNTISQELLHKISEVDGVKNVFGRRSELGVSAQGGSQTSSTQSIDLISYDDVDLNALKNNGLLKANSDISKVKGNSRFVLATWDKSSSTNIGDEYQINGKVLTVAGLLKYDPFHSDGETNGKTTLITSDKTFTQLTGIKDYSLVMIQVGKDVTDKDVDVIRNIVGNDFEFRDARNEQTAGTYFAFVFCVYSFLAIIALVTMLSIVNSISMSVTAKIKQYGAMRAVGMGQHQMIKMIITETATYSVFGLVIGCVLGVLLSKLLFDSLISSHFSYAIWYLPIRQLTIVIWFVVIATVAAAYVPIDRIRNMSITETINQL